MEEQMQNAKLLDYSVALVNGEEWGTGGGNY